MNATTKFAGFTLGLAAVFGIALGVGALVGPEPDETAGPAGHGEHSAAAPAGALPGGLLVTDQGYTLALDTTVVKSAAQTPVSFRIL
ncbi:hypothetical protein AB0I19_27940, partial [Nocardia sp. NPDC050413]